MNNKQRKRYINPEVSAPIRNGVLEHIKAGKLCPTDLGIYTYLHIECNWSTGIFFGTAQGIAYGFSDEGLKSLVQESLRRLRDAGFINYRDGDGRRKGYPILIHKFRPRFGKLFGLELNAWSDKGDCVPEYVPITEERLDSKSFKLRIWLPAFERLANKEVECTTTGPPPGPFACLENWDAAESQY